MRVVILQIQAIRQCGLVEGRRRREAGMATKGKRDRLEGEKGQQTKWGVQEELKHRGKVLGVRSDPVPAKMQAPFQVFSELKEAKGDER